MDKKQPTMKYLVALHLLLMIYSLGAICSKKASMYPFLSMKFCFYYSIVFLILVIYAVGWQQIIKRMPLTTAFANKAITVVWGLIWGILLFSEKVTIGKIIGILMVVSGVVIFALSDNSDTED